MDILFRCILDIKFVDSLFQKVAMRFLEKDFNTWNTFRYWSVVFLLSWPLFLKKEVRTAQQNQSTEIKPPVFWACRLTTLKIFKAISWAISWVVSWRKWGQRGALFHSRRQNFAFWTISNEPMFVSLVWMMKCFHCFQGNQSGQTTDYFT